MKKKIAFAIITMFLVVGMFPINMNAAGKEVPTNEHGHKISWEQEEEFFNAMHFQKMVEQSPMRKCTIVTRTLKF